MTNYKDEQKKQDEGFEKGFNHSDTCDSNMFAEQNSTACICQLKKIKSYLLSRDAKLLEAFKKDVEELPMRFSEYESDDRDAGAKSFKDAVLALLKDYNLEK